jgi:hypothetical protein
MEHYIRAVIPGPVRPAFLKDGTPGSVIAPSGTSLTAMGSARNMQK